MYAQRGGGGSGSNLSETANENLAVLLLADMEFMRPSLGRNPHQALFTYLRQTAARPPGNNLTRENDFLQSQGDAFSRGAAPILQASHRIAGKDEVLHMGSMHVMPAILDDGAIKTSYTAGGGEATTNVVDNYQLLVSGVHHNYQFSSACRCYIRVDATLCS